MNADVIFFKCSLPSVYVRTEPLCCTFLRHHTWSTQSKGKSILTRAHTHPHGLGEAPTLSAVALRVVFGVSHFVCVQSFFSLARALIVQTKRCRRFPDGKDAPERDGLFVHSCAHSLMLEVVFQRLL